jgi:hypothetical protein
MMTEPEIQGEHHPLCFEAIRDVRVGDWGPTCFTCQVLRIVEERERAKYVNPDCAWGEGECVADCPSCTRLDELISEREAGAREMQSWCVAAVEALATERELRSPSGLDVDIHDVITAIKGVK